MNYGLKYLCACYLHRIVKSITIYGTLNIYYTTTQSIAILNYHVKSLPDFWPENIVCDFVGRGKLIRFHVYGLLAEKRSKIISS